VTDSDSNCKQLSHLSLFYVKSTCAFVVSVLIHLYGIVAT